MGFRVRCVFTHVSDVLSHSLALNQGGDPEAVVPVATAEEQLAVVGGHKQPGCYLQAGGEGPRQETLGPIERKRRVGELRNDLSEHNTVIKGSIKVFSLGVGHCGVLNEGEVVGDVLVVRQPPMGPNQAVLTNRHLETMHEDFTVYLLPFIHFFYYYKLYN